MSERKRIGNYIEYLKQKSSVNKQNNENLDYDKCFNLALQYKNNGDNVSAVEILNKLYAIKKQPDVLELLQELKSFNSSC